MFTCIKNIRNISIQEKLQAKKKTASAILNSISFFQLWGALIQTKKKTQTFSTIIESI